MERILREEEKKKAVLMMKWKAMNATLAVRAGNHLHCEWGGEGLRLSGHCERKCVCAKTED